MINYRESPCKNDVLKQYIKSYTSSIGILEENFAKHITRAFPSLMTQLLFEFSGGLSEIKEDKKCYTINKSSYINIGVRNWIDIYQTPTQLKKRDVKNFLIEFYPHTVFSLFKISPKELIQGSFSFEDILGKSFHSILWERLESANNHKEFIAIFEDSFLKMASLNINENILDFHTLNFNKPLNLYSKDIGYSTRWIQKKSQEVYGHSFKMMQNNMRFLNTLKLMERQIKETHTINLSVIAQDGGYYDQSHFIKEFKKFSGMTPNQYLETHFRESIVFFW